jgi:hypothetical protein
MEFSVSYEEGLGIVSGRIEGDLTVENAAEYFARVGNVAGKKGCLKVLTDVRRARLNASEEGMLELAKGLNALGVEEGLWRAIVVDDDVKGYKVWENCCFRQGHHRVKLFFDLRKAIDWLDAH